MYLLELEVVKDNLHMHEGLFHSGIPHPYPNISNQFSGKTKEPYPYFDLLKNKVAKFLHAWNNENPRVKYFLFSVCGGHSEWRRNLATTTDSIIDVTLIQGKTWML